MRAINNHEESVYRFGEFQLEVARRLLLRNGEAVPLTPKRFDMLLVLIRNRDRVIDKDELMREVWQETVVEETNLTHNISVLRKALGERPGEHRFIVTIPGQGYRFIAEVSDAKSEEDTRGTILIERSRSRLIIEEEDEQEAELQHRDAENAPAASLTSLVEHNPAPGPQQAKRKPTRQKLVVITVLAVAGLASLVGLAVYLTGNRRAASPEPFQNILVTRLMTANKVTSAVISGDGKYLAYVLEDNHGQALWLRHLSTSSNACIVPAASLQYWGITFSPDSDYVYYCTFDSARSGHNLYRLPILGGAPVLLPIETNTAISFSPDGRQFAYVVPSSEGSRLHIANLDGSENRVLARRQEPEFFLTYPGAPAWSPDGRLIACTYAMPKGGVKCGITAFRVEDGTEVSISTKFWDYVGQIAWLTGGSRLIFAASEEPGAPEQLWQLSLTDGALRRLTNDLSDYRGVCLTANSESLVSVQQHVTTSLWLASAEKPEAAELLTSETGPASHVEVTSDGRILYSSTASGKYTLQALSIDTKGVRQLPVEGLLNLGFSISGDNRQVIFPAVHADLINLWRYDFTSGEVSQLTRGEMDNRPHCSQDGQWVIYEKGFGNSTRTFWKSRLDGAATGEPVQVTNFPAMRPALSPDGSLIAYFFLDRSRPQTIWRIGIISSNGGAVLKKYDIPKTVTSRFVNWTPDGKAVAYINDIGGVSNIWIQPLAENQPQQLTRYQTDRIVAFDWSPDGRFLAISRAAESSYVALLTDASQLR